MVRLSLAEAISALDARVEGISGASIPYFPEVSIDTRSLQSGEAFFAILGESLDGHRFIQSAIDSGAAVIVFSAWPEEIEKPPHCLLLKVDDTTAALQGLARQVRMRWGGTVVAITGSMGKTTTRTFTAALLRSSFRALESPANFNNHIGLPLSLLSLREADEVAVLELGMNHPGEIDLLGRLCEPDQALITNVAPVHIEFFHSLAAIADAKAEIITHLTPQGKLFLNRDDPLVAAMSEQFAGNCVTYGFESADYQVQRLTFEGIRRMKVRIRTPEEELEVDLPFIGRHFAYAAVAAMAVALENGVPIHQVHDSLQELAPLSKRGQIVELRGITIWDDSYNSNPQALSSVIDTVASLQGFKRRILVLGDMLELGEMSEKAHREIGRRLSISDFELLVTVGEISRAIGTAAILNGFPEGSIRHFCEAQASCPYLQRELRSGDLVLVKGSRGIHLETVIKALKGVHA